MVTASQAPSGDRADSRPPGLEPRRLQCHDVWGGHEATETMARTAGLDCWTLTQPCEGDEGGDVFLLSSCSSGRITRALLADVQGHDEVAARLAGQLRELMTQTVDILNQRRLVRRLNRGFALLQEHERFASALVASYFQPSGVLSVCNAGHPAPLLFCSQDGRWSILEAGPAEGRPVSTRARPLNLPLGIFGSSDYSAFDVELHHDDLVLLYTDGLTEATQAGDDLILNTEGLLQLVQDLDPSQPHELPRRLLERVEEWSGTRQHADDLSIVVMQRNDEAPSLGSDVVAPLRLLKNWLRSLAGSSL
jgi:serine phosphatase RsbU (regulator of sigma subunit)